MVNTPTPSPEPVVPLAQQVDTLGEGKWMDGLYGFMTGISAAAGLAVKAGTLLPRCAWQVWTGRPGEQPYRKKYEVKEAPYVSALPAGQPLWRRALDAYRREGEQAQYWVYDLATRELARVSHAAACVGVPTDYHKEYWEQTVRVKRPRLALEIQNPHQVQVGQEAFSLQGVVEVTQSDGNPAAYGETTFRTGNFYFVVPNADLFSIEGRRIFRLPQDLSQVKNGTIKNERQGDGDVLRFTPSSGNGQLQRSGDLLLLNGQVLSTVPMQVVQQASGRVFFEAPEQEAQVTFLQDAALARLHGLGVEEARAWRCAKWLDKRGGDVLIGMTPYVGDGAADVFGWVTSTTRGLKVGLPFAAQRELAGFYFKDFLTSVLGHVAACGTVPFLSDFVVDASVQANLAAAGVFSDERQKQEDELRQAGVPEPYVAVQLEPTRASVKNSQEARNYAAIVRQAIGPTIKNFLPAFVKKWLDKVIHDPSNTP